MLNKLFTRHGVIADEARTVKKETIDQEIVKFLESYGWVFEESQDSFAYWRDPLHPEHKELTMWAVQLQLIRNQPLNPVVNDDTIAAADLIIRFRGQLTALEVCITGRQSIQGPVAELMKASKAFLDAYPEAVAAAIKRQDERWEKKQVNRSTLAVGADVQVVEDIRKRDYTDEGHQKRLEFAGRCGYIIAEHNSHGLCYDVQFSTGIATYDPDELISS